MKMYLVDGAAVRVTLRLGDQPVHTERIPLHAVRNGHMLDHLPDLSHAAVVMMVPVLMFVLVLMLMCMLVLVFVLMLVPVFVLVLVPVLVFMLMLVVVMMLILLEPADLNAHMRAGDAAFDGALGVYRYAFKPERIHFLYIEFFVLVVQKLIKSGVQHIACSAHRAVKIERSHSWPIA